MFLFLRDRLKTFAWNRLKWTPSLSCLFSYKHRRKPRLRFIQFAMSSSIPFRRSFRMFHKTMNPIMCGGECASVKDYFIHLTGNNHKNQNGGVWNQAEVTSGNTRKGDWSLLKDTISEMIGLVNGGINFEPENSTLDLLYEYRESIVQITQHSLKNSLKFVLQIDLNFNIMLLASAYL